ncbi:glycosyltransferase family 2 protein [Phycisphaera mikurensis]|uniref:Putative glycosyltransferase n=1 Tax=Phycisphaera mikurensis (strain NBRC 102666 / KCTC 22515 / FYK2301M01) TaxID=1142394 RepID=I0IG93_PHYMF|nr:glycosyltransferase family 2 protein [Phycisphaera mikurensis]MBB6440337.1 glycosyltransferase involved in cell wall biosynthesis [Phycisphaera mikurensis]BAM04281.1 putative glycosyltransferase [Phycisphaera mikurensis NBRC 102666]
MPLLSILIPVFNEAATVKELLARLRAVELAVPREVLLIDDGSTDGTAAILAEAAAADPELRVITQPANRGKGAAVAAGIAASRGDWLLIQDADLEYAPSDIPRLLEPVLAGDADAVYGSRFVGGQRRRVNRFWHTQANRCLTTLCNAVTDLALTDMECCYKLLPGELARSWTLQEAGFGIEPEITCRLAREPRLAIFEVGIRYLGRGREEGKKIGWRDGVRAVWCVAKYGILRR